MAGPRLINSGKPALEAIAKVLPQARPITVQSNLGPVELKPGTIWSGNRMLVYPTAMSVVYAVDDRLYDWGTSDFIREEWFSAISRGAQSASHWVVVAQAEFALLSGMFVPWYVLLGLGCAKTGLFYKVNQPAVDTVFREGPRALRALQDLRRQYPTLFEKIAAPAARDLLVNLPSGVTAQDVAFFVGRVLKGVGGAPEVTVGAVVKIAAKVAAIVTATHLPGMAAHVVGQAAANKAGELRRSLAQAGYTVTDAEAKSILNEVLARPGAVATLQQLDVACKALLPTLNQLKNAYNTMH